MDLTNKNILIISPEAWGKSFVSKHHYACELGHRGNQVFFLNPPSSSFSIEDTPFEGVSVVNYVPRYRGLGKMPRWLSKKLTGWEWKRLERKLERPIDVLWNFDSSRFFNLESIPDRVLKIQHIVDYTEDLYRDIGAQTSNLCFATTDFIAAEQRKYNANTFKIHHGAHQTANVTPVSLEITTKESILVGYVGNLSIKYLDWNLVYQLATAHQDIGFVFIGPMGKSNLSNSDELSDAFERVRELKNTYFTGAKPASDIPELLLNFDILLVAYKAAEYREQLASPHKFMEYFITGKVILSTYTDEYKDKRDLLVMADENEELIQHLTAIKENIEYWNSETLLEQRRNFARKNTYSKQVDRIEALLKKHT